MKKKFLVASVFLMSIAGVNAQSQGNQKTSTKTKSTNTKKTPAKNQNTRSDQNNRGTTPMSAPTNTGTNQTNTGTNSNENTNQSHQGQTDMAGHTNMNHTDTSGELTSTGRYAAMGVSQGSLHRKDMKFIMLANSSNSLELMTSQIALQKATNQQVRDYAAMMVEHHTMAGQEMKQMLSTKGAMIPDTAMLSRHRSRVDMLQTLQGAAFDKAYMRMMIDAHEEDLDEFEDETTDARDADIRAMATRMMPILRTHYTRAKQISKQL